MRPISFAIAAAIVGESLLRNAHVEASYLGV